VNGDVLDVAVLNRDVAGAQDTPREDSGDAESGG
jgi:hypothetical protein